MLARFGSRRELPLAPNPANLFTVTHNPEITKVFV